MRILVVPEFLAACGAVALLLSFPAVTRATIVEHQITSHAGDGEARSSSAGVFSVNQGSPTSHLRVGFQSGFGSDGQPAGGLAAVWFFRLPELNLAAGDFIDSVSFVTTLLDENAASPITPRFNADLYALGFTSTPAAMANGTFFFAGQEQSGAPGLGENQTIQKMDNDFFTIFTDWQDVNAVTPRRAKPIFADFAAEVALRQYIQGIYDNPAFPNDGNQYLVLRLNPDRAANETYQENGTQFYGKGTTRYRVASSESGTLQSTDALDYSDVIPTRLTVNVSVPEPGSCGLLTLGLLAISGRRSRR